MSSLWNLGLVVCLAFFGPALRVSAGIPDYDFDWVVVGELGNPAYEGGPVGTWAGRGHVDYYYRISRLEVTSAQWLEFINVFAPQSDNPLLFLRPLASGLQPIPGQPGHYELRSDVDNAGTLPVWGISWRDAARYVNWLHNNKATDWSAIMSGAYDASTFGNLPNSDVFTDQLTHSPDARFWIPTLDEWLKAAHYDANRHGPGLGGWWNYSNSSDEPLTPGLPGDGQTSAGEFDDPLFDPTTIPLGSYPDQQSPWGLLDLSGGASEWTEEANFSDHGPVARFHDGAPAGFGNDQLLQDAIYVSNLSHPQGGGIGSGLRVVSAVPAPGGLILVILALGPCPRKRKRRSKCITDVRQSCS